MSRGAAYELAEGQFITSVPVYNAGDIKASAASHALSYHEHQDQDDPNEAKKQRPKLLGRSNS